jgi:hypothetical protein
LGVLHQIAEGFGFIRREGFLVVMTAMAAMGNCVAGPRCPVAAQNTGHLDRASPASRIKAAKSGHFTDTAGLSVHLGEVGLRVRPKCGNATFVETAGFVRLNERGNRAVVEPRAHYILRLRAGLGEGDRGPKGATAR